MSYGQGPSSFVPPPQMPMNSGMYSSNYAAGSGGESPWLEKVKEYSSKAEDLIDMYTQPVKPYLPALGRFLIVVTFYEDALRIMTQWSDQTLYLHRYRHIPLFFVYLFLVVNVVVMMGTSTTVILRRFPEASISALFFIVFLQGLGYGLITDLNFFLRNLSVLGGLLMVLSDSLANQRKNIFAGLPNISETDKKIYFQLAGRVLLIFLFIGFVFQGEWGLMRLIVSVLGFCACVMVAVGFKARWSATFLVLLLSILNVRTLARHLAY